MILSYFSSASTLIASLALASATPIDGPSADAPPPAAASQAPMTRLAQAAPGPLLTSPQPTAAAAKASAVRPGAPDVAATEMQATLALASVAPPEGAPPPFNPFADDSDEEIVEKVRLAIEAITTMNGDFEQTAPSGAISTGKFWIRRPGQMRFEYAPPSPLLIVATQGNVYVQDRALNQTDLYPLRRTPLRFLLSERVDLQSAGKILAVERSPTAVAITFGETDEGAEGELTAVFLADGLALKEWIVRDPQNGLTIVSLDNVQTGGKFDNRLFRAPEAGGRFINN